MVFKILHTKYSPPKIIIEVDAREGSHVVLIIAAHVDGDAPLWHTYSSRSLIRKVPIPLFLYCGSTTKI